MPRTVSGLITLIVAALVVAAVLIGRSTPATDPASVLASVRTSMPPRFSAINGFYYRDRISRLLDVVTGETLPAFSEPVTTFNFPACSPWQDAQGRWQMVTVWTRKSEAEDPGDQAISGLARFSYPDSRPLDRVGFPFAPRGPACWLPGSAARVMYAGDDGMLYRFDFEEADGTPVRNPGVADRCPRPLRWLCSRPTEGWCYAYDPSCPVSMPDGPWIFASLCWRDGTKSWECWSNGIWWLRLSQDGDSVVRAGLLTGKSGVEASDCTEFRSPIVAASGSGKHFLAFLFRCDRDVNWSVRVAALAVDPSSGDLCSSWEDAQTLAVGAVMSPLAFSPDGRFVFALVVRDGGRAEVVRLANPLAVT